MTLRTFRPRAVHAAALFVVATFAGIGAMPTWAAGSAAAAPAVAQAKAPAARRSNQPVVIEESVTLFDAVPGTVYLNGGIGQGEQASMRKDARNWPLRMTFSDKSDNEFVAGVKLKVFDAHGNAVLRLKDAGPMTYVQLPKGEYRVTADYKGQTLTRTIEIGARGLDANFHWLV